MSTTQAIATIITAVFASTGFWTLLNNIYLNRREKNSGEKEKRDAERAAILGLLHETLAERCLLYLQRGEISRQEYEDLRQYIYEPYKSLGGNGTGETLMSKVEKLHIV